MKSTLGGPKYHEEMKPLFAWGREKEMRMMRVLSPSSSSLKIT
jgi:hypothetical protein